MTAYNKYLRQLAAQNDLRGQRKEHAQWTALVEFGHRTVAEIAERWPTLLRNKDAYSTVHKAVGRFASDIRLTIPARTLDKSCKLILVHTTFRPSARTLLVMLEGSARDNRAPESRTLGI